MAAEYEFGFIDEPLVLVYLTPVSITANGITRVRAREIILEKHFTSLSKHPSVLARHLRDLGNFKCVYESCSTGRTYLAKSIKKNPADLAAWQAYLLSFMGKEIYRKIYFNLYKKVA